MKAIPLLVLVFLSPSCTGNRNDARDDANSSAKIELATDLCPDVKGSALRVSIADLASHPDRYNGKVVSVSGYYYSYFEHSAIYSTQETESYSHKFSDGLWIQGISPFAEVSGKYLTLNGAFSSERHGHLGQWPGTICVTTAKAASPDAA
jgi:hypothetical protein